jgi:DNA-binding MarR family transcriptional regulator
MYTIAQQLFHVVGLLELTGNRWTQLFGITIQQYELLYRIDQGNTTNDSLHQTTGQSKENISQKIKKCEKIWFIHRIVDQHDKRVWHYHLTAEGKHCVDRCQILFDKLLERDFVDILPEHDRVVLSELLNRIITVVQQAKQLPAYMAIDMSKPN